MARCRRYRQVTVEREPLASGVPVTKRTVTKCCPKTAKRFFKVKYSSFLEYRKHETKTDDVFGLCEECASDALDPAWWSKKIDQYYRSVKDLRGVVASVEEVQADKKIMEQSYAEERKAVAMDGVKADFLRKMRQKNTASFTLEDWRQIFDQALDDFVVFEVQEA